MTLVNRISLFFLCALAAVLAISSSAVYLLVRYHLNGEFDGQLGQTLATLVAAVEVEDDDVKWQPADHQISLNASSETQGVWWCVLDGAGQVVDRSPQWQTDKSLAGKLLESVRRQLPVRHEVLDIPQWRVIARRLVAAHPKESADREPGDFEELTVVAARDDRELQSALKSLALASFALPASIWLVCVLLGRWFCRKALAPLRHMAHDARSMSGADARSRLSHGANGDELSELGSAFNSLLERLDQTFERQQSFVGNAAHQLRTPLTALRGDVEVTLRHPRSAEDYAAALRRMENHIAQLHGILESLLFLARGASPQSHAVVEAIALDQWWPRYAQRWEVHPRRADMEFIAAPGVSLVAHPDLLRQLLDNLIDNAIKYSEPGSRITCRAETLDGKSVISVEDHGQGISDSDLDRIFQPFFRSEQARRAGKPGEGLGLATAQQIAKTLGGELKCESRPGLGSRFTLAASAPT